MANGDAYPISQLRTKLHRGHRVVLHIRFLGRPDRLHSRGHGGVVRFPAHPEVALGRVSEQILQGRWRTLCTFQLQVQPPRG